ncbi:hypothetical protein [Kitasatospora cinereorecta]|uniref:Uncharacterized protein n=1 Tax=Kitasatospora cinereorecta TaxID=285560 RepID=A0ABW0V2S1_9ACTN
MFELLPGTGLALPYGAGVLRFGMTEREAQWAVATLADVRESWVCQAGWAFTARYQGLELHFSGDHTDRLGRPEFHRDGFAGVQLRRCDPAPTEPSAVPVVLQGIDLFGYPAAEVLAALGPDPHPAVRLPPAGSPSPDGYLPSVWLSADGPGEGAT